MASRAGVGMQVTVLGPVGVRRDGDDTELGERLQRLLAALVVSRGLVVSADRLADIVWEGDRPTRSGGTLRSYVTRLRQALDADRADVIAFRQPGYVIDLLPGELDSDVFENELDQALASLRVAEPAAAIPLLSSAIGRWRGDAFALVADEDWARPEAVRLEERLVEAREALVEARLGVGASEQAVADAQALVEAEPLRDRPRALLMRALYACGRQAEALRVATSYRRYLVDEVGLDPSEEIVELEGRIVRGAAVEGATQVLRGYELHERIGEGAFATVHRATQPGLQRDVAVKIIRAELADRPDFIRRFEIEAQTVARVEHPNVVPLFDFWREPGAAYLVMRLLRGGSVEQMLRMRGPYSSDQTVQLLEQIGGALESAHRAGVVHRDVRPANLLLDNDGATYLADFGIALPTASSGDLPIISPAYAAPEVLRGEPAGPAADVLSLGVTVFELLTGRLPFADSADRAEVIRRQLAEPLPPVRATRTDLPTGIDDVLARATAKAAGDRHGSVLALVDDLRQALRGESTHPSARRSFAASHPVANPYVGLHAFDEQDANRYFGREELVVELVDALERQPMVTVVGASGSGKSSVVRAGLLPAIRRGALPGSDDWFVTTMLPGAEPVDALETALLRVAVNPPASLRDQLAQPGGVLRAIRRVLPDERARILLVIDQFEELFTQAADPDVRDRLLTELAAAVIAPDSPLRVVATLRADHYDAPLRHHATAQLVTDGTVTVRPMSPDELERAITLPARAVGVEVEQALVVELVAAVTARTAALPLLQFSLTELFERRVGDVMLHDTHRELGGLTGALAARADRIVDSGDAEDEAETRRIFGRLVTLGEGAEDTRRRVLRRELGDGERTAWLLDAFVTARLLATDRDPATRQPTVEVAHEALLRDWPRLRAWLDEDRADLRTLRQITAHSGGWQASGHEPAELARGSRLESARDLAVRHPEWLNDTERGWIAASVAAADATIERDRRQHRRLRSLLVTAVALLVVAVVAAAGALVLRQRAVGSERDAEAARDEALANEGAAVAAQADAEVERLVAQSAAQVAQAPDLALLLALEANRRRDDLGTRTAIHRAFATEPRRVGMFPSRFADTSETVFDADASIALTVSLSGRAEWFDPSTGASLAVTELGRELIDGIAISGDGAVAAFPRPDGSLDVVGRSEGEVVASIRPDDLPDRGFPDRVALDRTGDRVAFVQGPEPRVIDTATGEVLVDYDFEDRFGVNWLEFSDDGTVLYVGWVDADFARFVLDVVDASSGELLERRPEPEGFGQVLTRTVVSDDLVVQGYVDGTLRFFPRDEAPVEVSAHSSEITDVVAHGDLVVSVSADDTVRLWSTDGVAIGAPVPAPGEIDSVGIGSDGRIVISFSSGGWHVVDPAGGLIVEQRWPVQFAHLYPGVSWYETPVDDDGGDPDNPDGFRPTSNEYRSLLDNQLVSEIEFEDAFTQPLGGPSFVSPDGEWVFSYTQGDLRAEEPNLFSISEVSGERMYVHDFRDIYARVTAQPPGESQNVAIRPENGGERFFVRAGSPDGRMAFAAWADAETGDLAAGPIELPPEGIPLLLADGRVLIGEQGELLILPQDLAGPPVIVDGSTDLFPLDQDEVSGRVLVAGPDGTVALLDVETASLERFEAATGDVSRGAFSPDGELAAVTTGSDGVQIYDVASGRRVGIPIDPDGIGLQTTPGVTWNEDGTGVWIAVIGGPTLLPADPAMWRETACGVIHRELTEEEWRTFVSPDSEPVASCAES